MMTYSVQAVQLGINSAFDHKFMFSPYCDDEMRSLIDIDTLVEDDVCKGGFWICEMSVSAAVGYMKRSSFFQQSNGMYCICILYPSSNTATGYKYSF